MVLSIMSSKIGWLHTGIFQEVYSQFFGVAFMLKQVLLSVSKLQGQTDSRLNWSWDTIYSSLFFNNVVRSCLSMCALSSIRHLFLKWAIWCRFQCRPEESLKLFVPHCCSVITHLTVSKFVRFLVWLTLVWGDFC